MPSTVPQLGARVLRRLGISPIPLDQRTGTATTVSVATLAARALRTLGVNPVAEADSLANSGLVAVAELATRALRRLAIVPAEDTPATADQNLAVAKVTSVHEALTALDYVSWSSGSIPVLAGEQYVIMAAHLLAPNFGLPPDPQSFVSAQEYLRQIALAGGNGQALAEAEVRTAHERLASLGLTVWAVDAIPNALAGDYVAMAAAALAAAYGKTVSEDAAMTAEARARATCIAGQTGQWWAEEKVRLVHASLSARGLARWSIFDIPTSVEQPIVEMASALLAPEVGAQIAPGTYGAAEVEIRRIIELPSSDQPLRSVFY